MALEQELATYEKHLPEWPEHEGKFVLIKGDDVIEFYVAYEDAIKAAYEKFKLEPFLVKQVQSIEAIQHITRLAIPSTGG